LIALTERIEEEAEVVVRIGEVRVRAALFEYIEIFYDGPRPPFPSPTGKLSASIIQ
jgi:hypothetical protein